MVFTEFFEMVEDRFSPELADELIDAVETPHGGAYTAVGNYPHEEIVAFVVALSQRTGVPVADLVRAFGRHLLGRFAAVHPEFFRHHTSLFDLLASIDGHIHVHVRKLYENATPPRFSVMAREERRMELLYESSRSMEDLAVGLLEGAADHFGERITIGQAAWAAPGRQGTLFTIDRH